MQTSLCVGCKEALDRIESGSRCRCEMERPSRMTFEPFCVVVDDVVDDSSGRDGALNGVEEVDELPVAMPPHARPITVPSRMLSAANRAVVRVHL